MIRGLHGMVRAGTADGWLAAFHKALRPHGILGIEQHRAPAGANPEESAKQDATERWASRHTAIWVFCRKLCAIISCASVGATVTMKFSPTLKPSNGSTSRM